MRILVDTHALLWEVLDDARLSSVAQQLWDDIDNQLVVSPASLWEIAIKVGQGKLAVGRPLAEFFAAEIDKNRLELLPVQPEHAARYAELPHHHKDPFDRLLVAQALCEGLPILSVDAAFVAYGVQRVW